MWLANRKNSTSIRRYIESCYLSDLIVDVNGNVVTRGKRKSNLAQGEIELILKALRNPSTNSFQTLLRSFHQEFYKSNLTPLENAEILWETHWRSPDGKNIYILSIKNPAWNTSSERFEKICPAEFPVPKPRSRPQPRSQSRLRSGASMNAGKMLRSRLPEQPPTNISNPTTIPNPLPKDFSDNLLSQDLPDDLPDDMSEITESKLIAPLDLPTETAIHPQRQLFPRILPVVTDNVPRILSVTLHPRNPFTPRPRTPSPLRI